MKGEDKKMILIGELINATRKPIANAINKRDAAFIKKIAGSQIAGGADYIDLNAGTGRGREQEKKDMEWLVSILNEFEDTGVCLDSSDPSVIKDCLSAVKSKKKMINSINGEKERINSLLPVIKENPECKVIGLTMDERGIPKDVAARIEISEKLIGLLVKSGLKQGDIFIDALLQPVSTDAQNGMVFLESISALKTRFPEIMTTCGLSNISFGLPNRPLINKYFLALAIGCGLDSAIADPLYKGIKEAVRLAEALTGKDEYCMNYIKMFREKS